MKDKTTRREFVTNAAAIGAGVWAGGLSSTARASPNETLNVAVIGAEGRAEEDLAPTGYVRVKGELWRAELVSAHDTILAGHAVRVHEIRGLTLLVLPGAHA